MPGGRARRVSDRALQLVEDRATVWYVHAHVSCVFMCCAYVFTYFVCSRVCACVPVTPSL